MSKKTYKNGNVYEDGIYRGPIGGSGFIYPHREMLKKYWVYVAVACFIIGGAFL